MEFESKILSRNIQEALYRLGATLGTAESCTGGRIAEAIISVSGASNYFKGGIIAYSNDVKESILNVSHETLELETAISENVAKQMVCGACDALNCTFAIAATGIAGPTGGTPDIPVGTIWIGYGNKDDVRAFKLTEDFGRDINLAIASNKSLQLFLDYLKERLPVQEGRDDALMI